VPAEGLRGLQFRSQLPTSPADRHCGNVLEGRISAVGAVVSNFNINDASGGLPNNEHLSTMLDWKRTGPLSVIVPSLDVRGAFSADKTCVMAGMAAELGQSLCRFMVNYGARYIVLASQNPVSDANWLADMRMAGAEVRAVKMDVADRAQVQARLSII
jgi:hypothetical protein